ncbi:phage tail protein [uncultured Ruegeria sp.]|uniref:phage tail protein n=1 Tax=uncultured Ruegeria sp. TaxID=259304 RepID=UPI002616B19F|nr:phage tail protein [uncultured Ruegeria sp.]
MADLQETNQWPAGIYQIETGDPVVGGPPNLLQGEGISNVQAQQLADRTIWLKAKLDALLDGADPALDTLNELAAALNDDANFSATVLTELSNLRTPVVAPIADDDALDAVNATSVWTAAQGVLGPPLAIGGIIEHTEFSDGSAMQKAYRITPAGAFLTKHIRVRRTGTWAVWTADGPDIGDLIIHTHAGDLLDRLEANGGVVSRTSYADLFWRMGTTYGVGDGASTFGIADLRGEFLRGWDNGRGIDPGRAIGSNQAGTGLSDRVGYHPNLGSVISIVNGENSYAELASNTSFAEKGPNGAATTAGINTTYRVRPRNVAQLFCVKF